MSGRKEASSYWCPRHAVSLATVRLGGWPGRRLRHSLPASIPQRGEAPHRHPPMCLMGSRLAAFREALMKWLPVSGGTRPSAHAPAAPPVDYAAETPWRVTSSCQQQILLVHRHFSMVFGPRADNSVRSHKHRFWRVKAPKTIRKVSGAHLIGPAAKNSLWPALKQFRAVT